MITTTNLEASPDFQSWWSSFRHNTHKQAAILDKTRLHFHVDVVDCGMWLSCCFLNETNDAYYYNSRNIIPRNRVFRRNRDKQGHKRDIQSGIWLGCDSWFHDCLVNYLHAKNINAKGRKIYPVVQPSYKGKLTLRGSRSFIQPAMFELF